MQYFGKREFYLLIEEKNGVRKLKKKKSIFEDDFKKIYLTDEEGKLVVKFKDFVPTKSPNKILEVKGKGILNAKAAAFLYKYLSSFHIATNFLNHHSDREIIVQQVDEIPLLIRVYNYVDKYLAEKLGLEEQATLNSPIVEYFLKGPYPDSPMVNQSHLQALDILSADDYRLIERLTAKVNAVLRSFFKRRHLELISFQLEFGKSGDKLVLTGDMTLDSISLADFSDGVLNFDKFKITSSSAGEVYNALEARILQS